MIWVLTLLFDDISKKMGMMTCMGGGISEYMKDVQVADSTHVGGRPGIGPGGT
jgi:hypothetical protein